MHNGDCRGIRMLIAQTSMLTVNPLIFMYLQMLLHAALSIHSMDAYICVYIYIYMNKVI